MYSVAPRVSSESGRGIRAPRPPAFTLVELVVVVAILAILASMTISRLAGRQSYQRVRAAANRIANDIHLTQRSARAASTTHQIEFDPTGHAYRIPSQASLLKSGAAYEVQLDDAPYEIELLSVDFGGDTTLAFDGYGVPVSDGELIIGVGDARLSLLVDSQGAVDVVEGGESTPKDGDELDPLKVLPDPYEIEPVITPDVKKVTPDLTAKSAGGI